MSANRPRRHHYLPQFYLEGFTRSGTRYDFLHVLDPKGGRRWKRKVPDVAFEKDLYAVGAGDDEAAVEKALAKIEGILSPGVKRIRDAKQMTGEQDFVKLLNFIAMMAVRTPTEMEKTHRPFEKIGKAMMREVVMTRQRYEGTVFRMKADGMEAPGLSYERMKDFVDRDQFNVRASQDTVVRIMLERMNFLVPLLFRRVWSLVVPVVLDNTFICSDRPVSLKWITDDRPNGQPPGFGLPKTMVTMPISKDLAIIGTFEGTTSIGPITPKQVATINSLTASGGRYVFGPYRDFTWLIEGDELGNSDDFVEGFRRLAASPEA